MESWDILIFSSYSVFKLLCLYTCITAQMNIYIKLNVIGNKQVNADVSKQTYTREVKISNLRCPEILLSLYSVFSVWTTITTFQILIWSPVMFIFKSNSTSYNIKYNRCIKARKALKPFPNVTLCQNSLQYKIFTKHCFKLDRFLFNSCLKF
jgi:hypothetical protein